VHRAARIRALIRRAEPDRASPSKAQNWDHVLVVFTRPDRDVARLDIAVGPCIAPPGRKRPLVGVTNQLPGDVGIYEALFDIVVANPSAGPWQARTVVGPGQLHAFSDEYVEALAELNREAVRRIEARPKDYDWIFEPSRAVFRRWMPDDPWPIGAPNVPYMASQLNGTCGWARIAQERSQNLYCWSGPGFNPWVATETQARRLIAEASKHHSDEIRPGGVPNPAGPPGRVTYWSSPSDRPRSLAVTLAIAVLAAVATLLFVAVGITIFILLVHGW
jgi:hypothetical protein